MDRADQDPIDNARRQYDDMAALKRLVKEGEGLERGTPQWFDLASRIEDLTRKIRHWASRPD